MRGLRHAASGRVGATVVTDPHAAGRPVGPRGEVQLAIADMGVGTIADEGGAVFTGAFGNQEVGACLCGVESRDEDDQKQGFV